MNLSDAHCHLANSELSYPNINYPMCICACFQKDWEQLDNLKNKFVKKAFGIFPNMQANYTSILQTCQIVGDICGRQARWRWNLRSKMSKSRK